MTSRIVALAAAAWMIWPVVAGAQTGQNVTGQNQTGINQIGNKTTAADSSNTPAFSAEDKAAIARVEEHLTAIRSIVADFTQIAPDGGIASGKFFLSRPGKMRWQYDPPTPILMVADGRFLIFYDYELDQTSYIPLESTLAGFLARDRIEFGGDVRVTDLQRGAGSLRITVVQKDKPKDGSLTLEFSDSPLRLHNMKVTDAANQQTTVSLANARYDQTLEPSLFVFENLKTAPRIGGNRGSGVLR